MRMRTGLLAFLLVGCAVGVGCSLPEPSDDAASSAAQTSIPTSELTLGEKRWIAISSPTPVAPEVTLSGDELLVRIGGYFVETAMLRGEPHVRVSLAHEESTLSIAGEPEMPIVRVNVPWSREAAPAVEVQAQEIAEAASAPPLPSRGTITRDVDPSTIGYSHGPFYQGTDTYPASNVEVGEAFDLRDAHGVSIQVQPFQYDARAKTLRVSTEVRLRLAGSSVAHERAKRDDAFEAVYGGAFGRTSEPSGMLFAAPGPEIAEPGRLLVITADAYADAVAPLVDWKIRRGLETTVKKMSAIGTTAAQIQAFIKSEFESSRSLTYVVLVGDADTVPTLKGGYERADCDACFGMVKGTDFYPDLFVSRISARSVAQVESQVAKLVAYERKPDAAGSWYGKAIGVASNEGSPKDWQRTEELRTSLEQYGYSVAKVYDPGAKKSDLIASVNAGVSLFDYMGHGSGTSWSTTGFSVSDVPSLDNTGKWPFIIDVACQNGSFVTQEPALAEAWLRAGDKTAPKGAIGMYASSTNAAWVPPTVMQAWAVRELLLKEKRSTVGSLAFGGAARVLETGTAREGQQLVEQYNVFGDASLVLRTKQPKALAVAKSAATGGTSVTVRWPDGTPAKGALAALSDASGVVAVGLTNDSGIATLSHAAGSHPALTVTAFNAIPFEGNL